MNDAVISIIIPAYNCESFLYECLNSVAGQSVSNFEVIIVDNNSTDDTGRIAQCFCETDERFKYLRCLSQGVSNARNAGLDYAKGDYLFFLDGDDKLVTGALKALCNEIYRCSFDVVACNILRVKNNHAHIMDTQGVDITIGRAGAAAFFNEKLCSYVLHNVFKLYRADFLRENNIRFDQELNLGEDLSFNIKVFEHLNSLKYLSSPLYLYRINNQGLTLSYIDSVLAIRTALHNKTKKYLMENSLLGDNYYLVAFNELLGLLTKKSRHSAAFRKEIISSDFAREVLFEYRKIQGLSFTKRLLHTLLRIYALLYKKGKPKLNN